MGGFSLPTLSAEITANATEFVIACETANNSMKKLVGSTQESSKGIETGMASASDAVKEFSKSMDTMESQLRGIGSAATSLGTQLSVAVTLPLVALAKSALDTAGSFEQAKVGMETMLGSGERAITFLDQLRAFSLKTPFQFSELVQASQRLMAFGFQAKEVIPVLTAVGDAASALGRTDSIDRLTYALGQMVSTGKVNAREMRQVAMVGIPAWDMLAAAIGKTEGKAISVAETMKRVTTTFVDGNMAAQAIIAGMEAKFGGLMEKQVVTFKGAVSNLFDYFNLTMKNLGDTMLPLAKRVTAAIQDILQSVSELAKSFAALPVGVQTSIFAFAALAAALGPALLIVGQFARAIVSISAIMPLITSALSGTSLGALGLVGALATLGQAVLVVAAAFVAWKLGEWLIDATVAWTHFISGLKVSEITGVFSQLGTNLKEAGSAILDALGNVMAGAVNVVANALSTAGNIFSLLFKEEGRNAVSALGNSFLDLLPDSLATGLAALRATFANLFSGGESLVSVETLRTAIGGIGDMLASLGRSFTTTFPTLSLAAMFNFDGLREGFDAAKVQVADFFSSFFKSSDTLNAILAKFDFSKTIGENFTAMGNLASSAIAKIASGIADLPVLKEITIFIKQVIGEVPAAGSLGAQAQGGGGTGLAGYYNRLLKTMQEANESPVSLTGIIQTEIDARKRDKIIADLQAQLREGRIPSSLKPSTLPTAKESAEDITKFARDFASAQTKKEEDAAKAEKAAQKAAAAAKRAQAEIDTAFKSIGLEDVEHKTENVEAAFKKLSAQGKLTGDALEFAMMNVARSEEGLPIVTAKAVDAMKAKWAEFASAIPATLAEAQLKGFDFTSSIDKAEKDLNKLLTEFHAEDIGELPVTRGVRDLGKAMEGDIVTWKFLQDQLNRLDLAKAFNAAEEAARHLGATFGTEISRIGSTANQIFPEIAAAISLDLSEATKPVKDYQELLRRLGITQRTESRANLEAVLADNAALQASNAATVEIKVQGWRQAFKAIDQAYQEFQTRGIEGFTKLEAAMVEIGTHSAIAFQLAADRAKELFDVIAANVASTRGDIDRAELGVLETEAAALAASGKRITDSMKERIADLIETTRNGHKTMLSQWDSLAVGVGKSIETMLNKATYNLLIGKGSFTEVWHAALDDMAKAFVQSFIEPVTHEIQKLVVALVKDLAVGGFGNVTKAIQNMGKTWHDVFGGSSGLKIPGFGGGASSGSGEVIQEGSNLPGGLPGDFGGEAGGAAGTGGIMGGLSSLTGAIGAVSAVVGAISSVISNFQFSHMNKKLGQIEVSTRGMLNQLISIQETFNHYFPVFESLLQQLTDLKLSIGQLGETITDRLGDLGNLLKKLFVGGIGTGKSSPIAAATESITKLSDAATTTGGGTGDGEPKTNIWESVIKGAEDAAKIIADETKNLPKTIAGLPAISVADIFPRISALFTDVRNLANSIAAGNRIPGQNEFQSIRDQFKSIADQIANSVNIDFKGNKDLAAIMAKLGEEIKNLSSAAGKVPKEAAGTTIARDAAKLQADEIASGYADLARQIEHSIAQVIEATTATGSSLTGLSSSSSAASTSVSKLGDAAANAASALGGIDGTSAASALGGIGGIGGSSSADMSEALKQNFKNLGHAGESIADFIAAYKASGIDVTQGVLAFRMIDISHNTEAAARSILQSWGYFGRALEDALRFYGPYNSSIQSATAAMSGFTAGLGSVGMAFSDAAANVRLMADVGEDVVGGITSPRIDPITGKLLPVPQVTIPPEVTAAYHEATLRMQQAAGAAGNFSSAVEVAAGSLQSLAMGADAASADLVLGSQVAAKAWADLWKDGPRYSAGPAMKGLNAPGGILDPSAAWNEHPMSNIDYLAWQKWQQQIADSLLHPLPPPMGANAPFVPVSNPTIDYTGMGGAGLYQYGAESQPVVYNVNISNSLNPRDTARLVIQGFRELGM